MSKMYYLKINGRIEEFHYTYDMDDQRFDGTSPMTWNNIPKDQFLSIDEMADHIISNFQPDDIKTIKSMARDELIKLHHGFGTWVRNTYGLWHPTNPNIIPGDLGDGHPDGVSMRVIETIHDRLINNASSATAAYDHAMSII